MAATLPISPISHKLCRSSRFGHNASTPRFCSPIFSISPCLIGTASELRARLPLVSSAVTTNSILHDVGATVAVLGGAYALVLSFDSLTKRNVIPQDFKTETEIIINRNNNTSLSHLSGFYLSLSRKLVHILSGLLFVLSWPIFSGSSEARYFAAFVPLVNGLRLVINGLSISPNSTLIKSVTREGRPEELLKGPLFYVIALLVSVLFFWRKSPVGMISLAMMCGGDGIADIMGRKFGSAKLPYNPRKSWAGSISMFIFGFFISIGLLYYYSSLGYLHINWDTTFGKVAIVSMVATVVESLPITDQLDDNVSVPLATILAAYLSFGY
ncbi:Phytol kinase 1 [Cardamine amara subsp. amara]|uniref:phytol kinase n=1 Tax=Cardamine amara subsp. amara TaxID=228776 RepID=A0ABD1A3M5_CARAN